MPDPSPLYTSPKVLFWLAVAGLYGILEAVGRVIRHTPQAFRSMRNKFRSKVHDTDFYYAYRESGYIIMPGGDEYINSRRERIVALKRIEEVPFRYQWTGVGEVTEELFPAPYQTRSLPGGIGQQEQRRIKFDKALEKGEEAEYTLLLKCKRTGRPPLPFLVSKSSHRVDELLMRVVFPSNLLPEKVFYVRRNGDDTEVHREQLKVMDSLTGEFRRSIKYAEPNESHIIEWQGNSTAQSR